MRIQNRRKIASVLFVLISFVCAAQKTPEPPPSPPPAPGTPIDGWVLIVLLIGLVYGVYKSFKLIEQ